MSATPHLVAELLPLNDAIFVGTFIDSYVARCCGRVTTDGGRNMEMVTFVSITYDPTTATDVVSMNHQYAHPPSSRSACLTNS